MANEPAKLLLPYLQRADELQKHEPLVAYYCRLYAMELGLKISQNQRTKTTNALLMSLLNQLEKDKKALKLSPDDNVHAEEFALNVFGKADKQDMAGRADLNTAKTFYAASIFLEILNQFSPLPPDLEQKQKYAAWKAADIRKALKEGRKPIPGPPVVEDDDLSFPSSTPSDSHDLGASETTCTSPSTEPDPLRPPSQPYSNVNNHEPSPYSYPNFQSYPSLTESTLPSVPTHHPSHYQSSETYNSQQSAPSTTSYSSSERNRNESHHAPSPSPSKKYQYDSSYQPPAEKIAEAHKAARLAVGALAFDDVCVAVDHLKKSLELLTNPSASH